MPWEFSDAINSFESLLRGMVEEFEENCETLLGSKLFVKIAVGSLCFLEAAEFHKCLLHAQL
jgi:hypothetical protein